MDIHMPREASAEGVHNQHKARQIPPVGIPVCERPVDNGIETIEVLFSVRSKVVLEFMGRGEDHMLVCTLGKKRRILLNPDVSLAHSATPTKPGFTGMGDFPFIRAVGAAVEVVAH